MARTKLHNLRKAIIVAVIPSLIVYALAIILSAMAGIEGILVIRDLAQTCKSALGIGLISNLGYLFWIATAAIALFTAYSTPTHSQHKLKELLLCGGWFSFILCIDDMFLLHDRYIGQEFLYVVYAIFAFLIVFRFQDQLLKKWRRNIHLSSYAISFFCINRQIPTRSRRHPASQIRSSTDFRRRSEISRNICMVLFLVDHLLKIHKKCSGPAKPLAIRQFDSIT